MNLLINKITETCLRVSGVWPYSINLLGPLVLLSTLLTTLPFQIWKVVLLINNPVLLMDSLSDILAEILIFMKLFALWMRKRQVQELIRRINKDWNKKNLPEEWKILARYCYFFCKFDITLYISASIFYYPDLISTYLKKPNDARQLLFQSYYPFDYQGSPWYEFLFVVQIIQAFSMMSIDTLSKSLLVTCIRLVLIESLERECHVYFLSQFWDRNKAVLYMSVPVQVLHVGARMNLLECHIIRYSSTCSNDKYINHEKNVENMKNIIIEHQHILSLVQKIDNVYSYISFFQIVFSNVIICVTGFVMITAVESSNVILLFKFFTYILAMLSQAFTFCAAGQYLQNKGESLLHLLQGSFWYKTRPEEMKSMLFILCNAQEPLTLKGGNFFDLSINTFAQILKTSFSYLSVLRAVYI